MKKVVRVSIIAVVVCVLIGVGLYMRKQKSPTINKNPGEPQTTVEEILKERVKQASKNLETPLGKALLTKQWAEIDKIYLPKTMFNELAEAIRAIFIESKMKDFSLPEQDHLLSYVIQTFSSINDKDAHLTGLLITQFDRLPAPPVASKNFKTLEEWATSSKVAPLNRRLALKKLVLHDSQPSQKAVAIFETTILHSSSLGQNQNQWISMIDDIRNHEVRGRVLKRIAKQYPALSNASKLSALTVLSHDLSVAPNLVKSESLHFLKSKNPLELEASLRALSLLNQKQLFSPTEKEHLVKVLTKAQTGTLSPFSTLKSQELLKDLK